MRRPARPVPAGIPVPLAVALGAALGGMCRAWVSAALADAAGLGPLLGTLAVNSGGSFLIGLIAVLCGPGGRSPLRADAWHFAATGFCGGFTTFSLFSLETMSLATRGAMHLAAANVGLSLVAWLGAVWCGAALAGRINRALGRTMR